MGRIKFDVNGQIFAIQKETIIKGPDSYLKRLCIANSNESHVIDRPPEVFSAVVALYQTGELHIPATCCPGAFLRELKFWDINKDVLANCCYYRLQHYLKKQENLSAFQARMQQYDRGTHFYGKWDPKELPKPERVYRWLGGPRRQLWAIVDHRKTSIISTVYFCLTMVMVLVSIFGLAFSTVPQLQRHMTNCERLDFMRGNNMDHADYVQKMLLDYCDQTEIPNDEDGITLVNDGHEMNDDNIELDIEVYTKEDKRMEDEFDSPGEAQEGIAEEGVTEGEKKGTRLTKLHGDREGMVEKDEEEEEEGFGNADDDLVDGDDNDYTTTWNDQKTESTTKRPLLKDKNKLNQTETTNGSLTKLPNTTLNVIKSLHDMVSNDSFTEENSLDNTDYIGTLTLIEKPTVLKSSEFVVPKIVRIKVPNIRIPIYVFKVIEAIGLVYFSLDLLLRLISCPSFLKYFTSVVNVMDVLALAGSLANVTEVLFTGATSIKWIKMIQLLQMFRSFRLFRLVDNFSIAKVLAYSLVKNTKDVLVMVVYLIAGVCIFSSALYVFENKSSIKSIPDGMYWAIITMTTVGYGDLVPRSALGRLVGGLCAVAGVMVFALAVPMVVNYFVTMYQYAEVLERGSLEVEKRPRSGDKGEETMDKKKNNQDMIELKVQKS